MRDMMLEPRFDFVSASDKDFIITFNEEIKKLGYDFGDNIGSGFCWGRFMIIYSKTGVKSKKVIARIYLRDDGIVLRMFFNDIDKHRGYIENAAPYIKEVFTGTHGNCKSCKNKKNDSCKFQKAYTLHGRYYEKCNGVVFEFWQPDVHKLPGYIDLLSEFYKPKRAV